MASLLATAAELADRVYAPIPELRHADPPYRLFWTPDGVAIGQVSDSDILIAFRGTDTLSDWPGNLRAKLVPWRDRGQVHAGFKAAFETFRPSLEDWVRDYPTHRLHLTGHSLGGALATLAAAYLHPAPAELVTFGSPRVGDASFVRWLAKIQKVNHQRVISCRDVVPLLPPSASGFRHHGQVVYVDRHGNVRTDTNGAERLADRMLDRMERGENAIVADHRMGHYRDAIRRARP